MAKKTYVSLSPESIMQDIQAGKIAAVYYLMGEESYYIDRLSDFLLNRLLRLEERDFNLITLFGAETDALSVVHAAMGFPMGAERLVVMVKEAQQLKDLSPLEGYLQHPQASTVLIFCHKNGTLDRRKNIVKLIEKNGVLFESAKLRDYQLPRWISEYTRRKKITIDPAAAELLAEDVGADLNRLSGELDKLLLSAEGKGEGITSELVRKQIGVSKEFNIFELTDALVRKDVEKVARIADYFEKNPKGNPIQKTLPSLFRLFSQLILAFYAKDRTKAGIAAELGITEWQVEHNILPAMKNYSPKSVVGIIAQIRQTDARSKGVNNAATPPGDLMKELLFYILHCG